MFRLGFRARIWVSRLDLRPEAYILTWSASPKGPNDLCFALGFGPLDWNLSQGISLVLGFGLEGWDLSLEVRT